jgi:hypothetical protein
LVSEKVLDFAASRLPFSSFALFGEEELPGAFSFFGI